MDEYLEGFDDALKSVPIVSSEYAALERERDKLKCRIAELEQQLAGANASIALFMGPDGEQHIERFAAAVRSLMER